MSKLELRMSAKPICREQCAVGTERRRSRQTRRRHRPQMPAPASAETGPWPIHRRLRIATSPPSKWRSLRRAKQTAAPENAFAKARDADVKRVTEKRKAERAVSNGPNAAGHLQRPDQELARCRSEGPGGGLRPPQTFCGRSPVRL